MYCARYPASSARRRPTNDYDVGDSNLARLRPNHIYATSSYLVVIEKDLGDIDVRYEELKMPANVLFGTADWVIDYQLKS